MSSVLGEKDFDQKLMLKENVFQSDWARIKNICQAISYITDI